MFLFFYNLEILIFFLIFLVSLYIFFFCLLFFINKFIIKKKQQISLFKNSAYECGFAPFWGGNFAVIQNYQVNFIILAILYILFDIEIIFLLGWSVYVTTLAVWTFLFLFIFILLILLGFFFEY